MLFKVGLENNLEGRSLAWVLGQPGCFAYGCDGEAALANTPEAILSYIDWVAQHEPQSWLKPTSIEVQLEETWQVYSINEDYERVEEGYEVNAWFLHDWKPLTVEDIERGLKLLAWSRADLLATVTPLTREQMERSYPGERWSILGILQHVGKAEWWYLDRLGLAFKSPPLPEDPFEGLELVRQHFTQVLSESAGLDRVVGIEGEFWSPRKMLRRAVWHERDHTVHIQKLLAAR